MATPQWYMATDEDGILTKAYETKRNAINDIPERGHAQRAINRHGVTVVLYVQSGHIYYVGKRANLQKQGLRFERQVLAGRARMAHMRANGTLRAHQQHAAHAYTAKYGRAKLNAKVAEWRRVHRSDVESATDTLLSMIADENSFGWEIEHMPFPNDDEHPYILDYAWPDVCVALDMHGKVHDVFSTPERMAYNKVRADYLARAGWYVQIIRVESPHDVRSDYVISEITNILELVETMRENRKQASYIEFAPYNENDEIEEAPF